MGIEDIAALNKEIFPEDEKRLWNEYWDAPQNEPLRIRIIELYLPLVMRVAKKMSYKLNQKLNTDEFLSAGVVGLHGAVSNYSRDKDVQFSTFAYKRIYGAMMDELRSRDPLTRTQRGRYKEICAVINRLTIENSQPPTNEIVAAKMSMSVQEVERYLALGSETVNLNQEFRDGLCYMDVLKDDRSLSPVDETHRNLAMERLRENFRSLSEREQKILFLRHYEDMSVKEIARVFEISEGRVSQIYQKIVIKMRALMNGSVTGK